METVTWGGSNKLRSWNSSEGMEMQFCLSKQGRCDYFSLIKV